MRLLIALLTVTVLAGCASSRVQPQNQAMPYEQLERIKVSNFKCDNIDQVVNNMERNLSLKGLKNASPENLNDDDRKYNAQARIIIWSMRIGCSNPDRYKK